MNAYDIVQDLIRKKEPTLIKMKDGTTFEGTIYGTEKQFVQIMSTVPPFKTAVLNVKDMVSASPINFD